MHTIRNSDELARALDSPIDPVLRTSLLLRRSQLLSDTAGQYDIGDLAHFVIIDRGDTVADVEVEVAFPLFTEPAFEWVQGHSGWYEGVVILSDDGFGLAVFVPDGEGVDPAMLSVLRDQAT